MLSATFRYNKINIRYNKYYYVKWPHAQNIKMSGPNVEPSVRLMLVIIIFEWWVEQQEQSFNLQLIDWYTEKEWEIFN